MSVKDKTYYILDYSTGRIIRDLDYPAVLVACRLLMQLPNPSWDIMDNDDKKIVTSCFFQRKDGTWGYTAPEKIEVASVTERWEIDASETPE